LMTLDLYLVVMPFQTAERLDSLYPTPLVPPRA
jgi:hypothetical protein